MSAPREKKLRPANESEQEKVLTPEEREAAAKRKTKQYLAIGLVIAVLCAALLFWDAGIIQRNTTALTVGDTKYSAAEVSYFYNLMKQDTMTYAQYGMNGYNLNIPAEEQFYFADPANDIIMSWADFFMESAIDELVNVTAAYDAAIAAGYSDEDVIETVDVQLKVFETNAKAAGYESLKQMLVTTAGKLVTPKVYRDIMIRSSVANLYLDEYTASLEFTEEDLADYYAENADTLDTVEYGYLFFRAEAIEETDADGDPLPKDLIEAAKDAALTAAKNQAAEVLEAWEAIPVADRADAIEQLVEEFEPSTNSTVISFSASSLSSALSKWLLDEARTPGEIGLVDYPGYGTYAILFHDRYLEEIPSVNARHILIQPEMDEGATTPTDAQMAAAKAKAEDILAQWKAGEATEESFAALADEFSQDGRDEDGNLYTPGGKYENIHEGDFVTNFNNWLFHEGKHEIGETGIVENDGVSSYYGYHVIYFAGENEGDFEWKSTARQAMIEDKLTLHQGDLAASYTTEEKAGIKYVEY